MSDQLRTILTSENFWSGVFASILAATIVAVVVFIFRNSFGILKTRREQGRKENELFDAALRLSNPYAPFAFGVVQGRALRYFVTAVFIAYIGDALTILFPFNTVLYIVALLYLYFSLKWLFRIERRALEIISSTSKEPE